MANYIKPVQFTETNRYGCGFGDDVYTVKEFKQRVKDGDFTDNDGYGHPVKDSKCDPDLSIVPSEVHNIPDDATHVVWYNR